MEDQLRCVRAIILWLVSWITSNKTYVLLCVWEYAANTIFDSVFYKFHFCLISPFDTERKILPVLFVKILNYLKVPAVCLIPHEPYVASKCTNSLFKGPQSTVRRDSWEWQWVNLTRTLWRLISPSRTDFRMIHFSITSRTYYWAWKSADSHWVHPI